MIDFKWLHFLLKRGGKKKPLYLQTLPRYTSTKKSVDRRSESNNIFSFPVPWFLQRWRSYIKRPLTSELKTDTVIFCWPPNWKSRNENVLFIICFWQEFKTNILFFNDMNFLKFYPSDLIPLDTRSIEESKWLVTW